MPKMPRLSGLDAVRVLETMGFRKVRQRGSHAIMRRGSTGCVVPLHRELKTGTLAGALRQAGISVDDFVRAMDK